MPMNFVRSLFTSSSPSTHGAMASTMVKNYIEQNGVVVFSRTWCSHSTTTKDTLDRLRAKFTVVELDLMDEETELADALRKLSGQRTMPNIYIDQKHIGGNSDLQALLRQGKLEGLLKAAGAL